MTRAVTQTIEARSIPLHEVRNRQPMGMNSPLQCLFCARLGRQEWRIL